MGHLYHSSHGSGKSGGKEEERMLRAGGCQEPETPFSGPGMVITPVNSKLCSQDPHNLGPGNAPSWMGGTREILPLPQELAIGGSWLLQEGASLSSVT